jgi:CheY-like chemotaxis protein
VPRAGEGGVGGAARPVDASDASRRQVVLVAENNRVSREVTVGLLRRCGFDVDAVNDGRAALQALSVRRYAAILMDWRMSDLDGPQLTLQLRLREGAGPHTPVIAMAAQARTDARERCLKAGMDDYLTKPLRQEALARVLDRCLTGRGVTRRSAA